MGRRYESIDDRLAAWLTSQPVFFVSTAPLASDGHVNCSPKGNRGEFAVVDCTTVAYMDQTGSGVETIAHLRENGRIVLMFCSFDGPPRIVRLHGSGRVALAGSPEFDRLVGLFERSPGIGVRSVITVDVTRISDSCGYGVPLMPLAAHRSTMDEWASRKGPDEIAEYQAEKNAVSVDGLPGVHG